MYLGDIRKIIRQVLFEIGLWSEEAEALVLGTGAVETHYNRIIQMSSGPARSFWQIEPRTALDICENYLKFRKPLAIRIVDTCGVPITAIVKPNKERLAWLLSINIGFAIALCRLKYRRVPEPLPPAGDVNKMAQYWKKHYNTEKGKGTVEKFVDAWISDVG